MVSGVWGQNVITRLVPFTEEIAMMIASSKDDYEYNSSNLELSLNDPLIYNGMVTIITINQDDYKSITFLVYKEIFVQAYKFWSIGGKNE
jgi:hypothetical protein